MGVLTSLTGQTRKEVFDSGWDKFGQQNVITFLRLTEIVGSFLDPSLVYLLLNLSIYY